MLLPINIGPICDATIFEHGDMIHPRVRRGSGLRYFNPRESAQTPTLN